MVFSMMASNVTHYDANWRFQLDDPDGNGFFVKILTEGGELAVTYVKGAAVLQSRITGVVINRDPDDQLFAICNDCPQDL